MAIAKLLQTVLRIILTIFYVTFISYGLQKCLGQSAPADSSAPSRITIFLVDYSSSRPNDTAVLAGIEHFAHVAALSPAPVAVGAIFFNSEQERLTLIGDSEGKLTTNMATFSRELRKYLHAPPAGFSPIDLALDQTLQIVNTLPPETDVTIVLLSDGSPQHNRLRPDLYPKIREKRERKREQLLQNSSEDFADAQMRLIDAGGGASGKELFEEQAKEQLSRCLQLGEALAARNVRFVSIGEQPYLHLSQLHAAAGGNEADIWHGPSHELIGAFDQLKLTSFPLVMRDQKELKTGQGTQVRTSVDLDGICNAVVATLAFKKELTDWDTNVAMTASVGSQVIEVRQENGDKNASVLTNAAGKVVGVALTFEGVSPENRTLILEFATPTGATAMPDATLLLHMKVRDDILPMFRPKHAPLTQKEPPFSIEAEAPNPFEFYFLNQLNERVPVKGVLAEFFDSQSGEFDNVPLLPSEVEEWLFETEPLLVPEAVYDINLWITTLEDRTFELVFPRHIHAMRQHASLIITPSLAEGDSSPMKLSFHKGKLFYGTLGDENPRLEHTLHVGLSGSDWALPVEVRIINMRDSAGTPIAQELVRPATQTMHLVPGRIFKLKVFAEVPPQLDSKIQDGEISFEIQFLRIDQGTPLPTELGKYEAELDDPTRHSLHLKRARVVIATSQVHTDSQTPGGIARPTHHKIVPAEVPIDIHLTLWISTDSVLTRSVTIPASISLRDSQHGSAISGLQMTRVQPDNATLEIPPGQRISVEYKITIPPGLTVPFTGILHVAGPNLLESFLVFDGTIPETLLAPTARSMASIFAVMAIMGTALIALNFVRFRRRQPGQQLLITGSGDNPAGLSVRRGPTKQVILEGDPDCEYEVRQGREARWAPMKSRFVIEPDTLSQDKVLVGRIHEVSDDGKTSHDLVVVLEKVFDRPPHEIEIQGRIVVAVPWVERITRARRMAIVLVVLAVLAVWWKSSLHRPEGLAVLQSLSDRWPNLHRIGSYWPF